MLGARIFNGLEAGLWFAIAIGCCVGVVRCPDSCKKTLLVAAPTFLIFGVSDVLEILTAGAGMPWWLWAIKTFCVLCLTGCYLSYRRIRSQAAVRL